MCNPSPDQQRRVTKAQQEVGRYWYTDLETKELRRKPLVGVARFIDFFWKKKHTVWEFYWWLAYRRAEADMMPLSNPIQSDNLPIKGFPVKYELLGGWTIPRSDLKYLTNGPLASEWLQQILVPAALGWPRILEVFKQFAPVVTVVAGLITIAAKWATVVEIVTWIKGLF